MRRLNTISAVLLSTTAILTVSAKADASLAELQARLEKAQKENLLLKTEKVERENLTMKAEALEQENAKLRAEAGKVSAQAVAQSAPVAAAPAKQKVARVAAASPNNDEVSARRSVNRALDNMPKDDPRRDMTAAAHGVPVSTVSPVVDQWSGIYIGMNAGYAANDVNTYTTTVGNASGILSYSSTTEPVVGGGAAVNYFAGPVVGGQVGYNHEFKNHIVAGAESDMDWADVNNNHITNTNSWAYTITPSVSQISSNSNRIGLDWLGTTRARIGYAFGNFMPYMTGGVAYGQLSSNGVGVNSFGYGGTGFAARFNSSGAQSYSAVKIGWALGAGTEYKVTENISMKAEYLYTQLSGINGGAYSTSAGATSCGGCSPSTNVSTNGPLFTQSTMGAFGIHQARVGLNYHTDWLASKPAVVAKY
jgi:opacity protein-like surface antigen